MYIIDKHSHHMLHLQQSWLWTERGTYPLCPHAFLVGTQTAPRNHEQAFHNNCIHITSSTCTWSFFGSSLKLRKVLCWGWYPFWKYITEYKMPELNHMLTLLAGIERFESMNYVGNISMVRLYSYLPFWGYTSSETFVSEQVCSCQQSMIIQYTLMCMLFFLHVLQYLSYENSIENNINRCCLYINVVFHAL